MVKIYADYDCNITDIKGIKGGWEWLYREVSNAIWFDGVAPTINWELTDIPASLMKRCVLIIK